MDVYEKAIADSINKIAGKDIYFNACEIIELDDDTASDIVGELVSWACQPTNITPITIARDCLKQFPEQWVSPKIKQTAHRYIDISDDWDYRRLLELCRLISPQLLKWALGLGENSENPDITEAVDDFKEILQAMSEQE